MPSIVTLALKYFLAACMALPEQPENFWQFLFSVLGFHHLGLNVCVWNQVRGSIYVLSVWFLFITSRCSPVRGEDSGCPLGRKCMMNKGCVLRALGYHCHTRISTVFLWSSSWGQETHYSGKRVGLCKVMSMKTKLMRAFV